MTAGPAHESRGAAPVCAVVVNWNGWRDTLVCLDSLVAQGGAPLRIVVCDNGSTDGSVTQLEGAIAARCAALGGVADADGFECPQAHRGVLSLHLVKIGRNVGYAGALNAGIAWARQRWAPRGYWLLNNDVEALPGALDALLDAHASVPDAGICGSVLLDWDQPEHVQAVAGVYRRWLGVGWHDTHLEPGTAIRIPVDYPVGASMYVDAAFLQRVGPLDPHYFLYCEEMDWAERGRRLGYRSLVALHSRVRHKEGASTGSRGGVRHKSLLSERYGVTSRLRITRKLWPHLLPVVWCSLAVVVADRLLHREWARARLVLSLMVAPASWSKPAGDEGRAA